MARSNKSATPKAKPKQTRKTALNKVPSSPTLPRRLNGKTSPQVAWNPSSAATATAVKSKCAPRRAPVLTPEQLPEPSLPLPLQRETGRWDILKKLFMWPLKLLDDFCNFTMACRHDESLLRTSSAATRARRLVAKASQEIEPHERSSVLKETLDNMQRVSMSTSFSGVDTPATAWMMLATTLTAELGMDPEDTPLPSNAFAVELHRGCQHELLKHPHSPEHVFGDITEFWSPSLKPKLQQISEQGLEESVLLPLIRSGKATCRSAWCVKHQRFCEATPVIHRCCFLGLLSISYIYINCI